MVKAGIVGFGKMGRAHADWIMNHPQMEFSAVCEKNKERAEAVGAEKNVCAYTDIEDFLRESGVDLVVVVTTNDAHEAVAIQAMEAGKDVVVEKPMTLDYESAQRMVAAARRTGRKLAVHQSSRWDRDYLLVRDTITSGRLGDILSIKSNVMLCDDGWPSWGIDGMANPWRIKSAYGGGMLWDWGPHLIDQMLCLKGRAPETVFGKLQISGVWGNEVEDGFLAVLDFGDNTICQIECSNNARLDLPRWYVIGTRGALLVQGEPEPAWDKAAITCIDESGNRQTEEITLHGVRESGMEGGFYAELVPYLEGRTDTLVDMGSAADTIKALELIKRSSEQDAVIKWV